MKFFNPVLRIVIALALFLVIHLQLNEFSSRQQLNLDPLPAQATLAPQGRSTPQGGARPSLQIIRTADQAGSLTGHSGSQDRNPFFWPEELQTQVTSLVEMVEEVVEQIPLPEIIAPKHPTLSMVIIGDQSLALLDNTFVAEGDPFGGGTVTKIGERSVVLEIDGDEEIISLQE